LEIFPEKQKTRVDFFFTEDYTGIKQVSLTDIIKKGKKLYYSNDGVETEVKRIYNRVIFDDLQQQTPEVQEKGKILLQDLEVEWVPHPNWFFRISKYTLPFINNRFVPVTRFLSEVEEIPKDLQNYVLKPLFSFAGQGVVIDVSRDDIEQIKEPDKWILQRKVKYADVIRTPDGLAKAESASSIFGKMES
jgi:glutathionylspermidine synthase